MKKLLTIAILLFGMNSFAQSFKLLDIISLTEFNEYEFYLLIPSDSKMKPIVLLQDEFDNYGERLVLGKIYNIDSMLSSFAQTIDTSIYTGTGVFTGLLTFGYDVVYKEDVEFRGQVTFEKGVRYKYFRNNKYLDADKLLYEIDSLKNEIERLKKDCDSGAVYFGTGSITSNFLPDKGTGTDFFNSKIPISITVDDLLEYSDYCYNDSTFYSKYDTIRINKKFRKLRRINYSLSKSIFYPNSVYIHKQPTLEGFIKWLRDNFAAERTNYKITTKDIEFGIDL